MYDPDHYDLEETTCLEEITNHDYSDQKNHRSKSPLRGFRDAKREIAAVSALFRGPYLLLQLGWYIVPARV